MLSLAPNATLIHPHHGAVTVVGREVRVVRGEPTECIVLHSLVNRLTIRIPIDRIDDVGIRPVMSDATLSLVVAALGETMTDEPANWSRRFKTYEQKVASGSIVQVSEVVRDISRRDVDRGVSPGEKRMLTRAQTNLIAELSLMPQFADEGEAIAFVDGLIPAEPRHRERATA